MNRQPKSSKRKSKKQQELAGSRVTFSFKKHALPPFVGLFSGLLVWGVLNSHILMAHWQKVSYKPPVVTNQTIDLNADYKIDRNLPARLVIEDIGVVSPIVLNDSLKTEWDFQLALRDGVVHYPGTAKLGQSGNTVIFGHSSGQVWAPGDYKFIFTHLEKLKIGNEITVEFEGIRYIFAVTEKKVVNPTEVSVLLPTKSPTLTLITCTPVGTDKNRLIITAKQITPAPSTAEIDAPADSVSETVDHLPRTVNPSFWSSLKDLLF